MLGPTNVSERSPLAVEKRSSGREMAVERSRDGLKLHVTTVTCSVCDMIKRGQKRVFERVKEDKIDRTF